MDWFFVAGEGKGDVLLNTAISGRSVEIWDAVSVKRTAAAATEAAGGKTRVSLDLPIGGSCFVVFMPRDERWEMGEEKRVKCKERVEIPAGKVWNVSFAYHDGIKAPPPKPIVMDTLRDWTTYGKDGEASSTSLRYFSGTATYKTTVRIPSTHNLQLSTHNFKLSIGMLKTGVAHVFVNGKDCGVVWCAPWKADVSAALREGKNEIEIRYTNNWYNRLVGDCFLKPDERVTRSTLRYWKGSCVSRLDKDRSRRRTRYSGPSADDPLQLSGIVGPVALEFAETR